MEKLESHESQLDSVSGRLSSSQTDSSIVDVLSQSSYVWEDQMDLGDGWAEVGPRNTSTCELFFAL